MSAKRSFAVPRLGESLHAFAQFSEEVTLSGAFRLALIALFIVFPLRRHGAGQSLRDQIRFQNPIS